MSHSVSISWTASADTVDGYNVYRSTTSGGEITSTKLNPALITGVTFVDASPVVGKSFYEVRSSLGGVESVVSNEISVSLPPAPPTNLVLVSAA